MERIVTARFFVTAQHIDDFKAAASKLIENTRKEEGCLFYNLYQLVENPAEFLFYEIFKSAASFDAHLETAHYKKAISKITGMFAKEPEVNIIK